MTGLVALRADLRRDGSPISLTDLIHAAVAQTLVEFPLVNARTDGRLLWRRERVHLGIAVSVPGGLVVPVIRDADRRSLGDLHDQATRLVEGARAGRLGPIAAFLATRPSFALIQRWLMATVLGGLAVRMATEARR